MGMFRRSAAVALIVTLILAVTAPRVFAQVQTGSITGLVTDTSGGILPGVTISLSGDKLIGGVQTQTVDATGTYRFDRLPPGDYAVKFELQGFKTIERAEIRVSAAFVATVNARMDIGQVNETIVVKGESPTVDTKSNLQQIILTQDILEGIPSGRDPWSVAKLIPGIQVATYDVGGTQSYQASQLSAHGSSTSDVSYKIDGATVNWPGSAGGTTMLYYDQGMFEEVNYMTSAIPAEELTGGISINMVTKDAGNAWRGNVKYYFANKGLQFDNTHAPGLPQGFLGNPLKQQEDFNVAGGGALAHDRLWVNGSIRRWLVNKYISARNLDGSQALDDNTLKNFSGKLVFALTPNQKLSISENYNNKIRGHRRDTPPNIVPDNASLTQHNPAGLTQARYTGIRHKLVYESSFSLMKGETDYGYQPGTPASAFRVVDNTLDTALNAAQRQEEQPNSRTQFDNTLSYTASAFGDHFVKTGVQYGRLYFDDRYAVLNDMYLNYSNGKSVSVSQFNTPTEWKQYEQIFGVFVQDAWTVANHLTLNLGARFDHNAGTIPAQSTPGGQFVAPQSVTDMHPISQNLGVWRTGLSYDPKGDGLTAIKASYSRYALQVGIDRVTNVNPLSAGSRTCPWSDPNPEGTNLSLATVLSEINTSQCTAFPTLKVHYANANGPRWPYSDEISAGLERQLIPDMRVGVMYYHRTNRDQIGTVNAAVPPSAYVPVTINVPNGPNGATTATLYNLASPSYNSLSNLVLDNQSYLDTTYNGVEFTANKRFSHRWQMVAGLTVGKNVGGLNTGGMNSGQSSSTVAGGQSTTVDLNDPNNTLYTNGIVGNDSRVAFRLSGSYVAPGDISIAGSLISNTGFPYVSQYTVTRAIYPGLVRASQAINLSDRGAERLPAVTMADLRFSRKFKFGPNVSIVPQVDVYNIANVATIVTLNANVGGSYLVPSQIVAPRIVRLGVSFDF